MKINENHGKSKKTMENQRRSRKIKENNEKNNGKSKFRSPPWGTEKKHWEKVVGARFREPPPRIQPNCFNMP